MFYTVNGEKERQPRPKAREVAFTFLWLVLLFGAMAFIAFAGHV
jgi:hypothetical protein